jgi:hypothetical protein
VRAKPDASGPQGRFATHVWLEPFCHHRCDEKHYRQLTHRLGAPLIREVLEQSSQRWHQGKHDAWPALNFLLFILTQACKEFEQRVGQIKSPRGAKTELVEHAIESTVGEFGITNLERAGPGVSREMIRLLLRDLKAAGRIECLGANDTSKHASLVISRGEPVSD